MNLVINSGYIASDPELRYSPTGKLICTFSLALRRGKEQVDFVPVVCWEATAKFVAEYFRKGSGIEVRGELRQERWKDAEGNPRSRLTVLAKNVEFPKTNTAEKNEATAINEDAATEEDYAQLVEDENAFSEGLPF